MKAIRESQHKKKKKHKKRRSRSRSLSPEAKFSSESSEEEQIQKKNSHDQKPVFTDPFNQNNQEERFMYDPDE